MTKTKVILNRAGVRALMNSSEMQTVLQQAGSAVLEPLSDGYAHDMYFGKSRPNVMIYADSPRAYYDNLKNNSLLKALGHAKR